MKLIALLAFGCLLVVVSAQGPKVTDIVSRIFLPKVRLDSIVQLDGLLT
jgi:hypothetical protein